MTLGLTKINEESSDDEISKKAQKLADDWSDKYASSIIFNTNKYTIDKNKSKKALEQLILTLKKIRDLGAKNFIEIVGYTDSVPWKGDLEYKGKKGNAALALHRAESVYCFLKNYKKEVDVTKIVTAINGISGSDNPKTLVNPEKEGKPDKESRRVKISISKETPDPTPTEKKYIYHDIVLDNSGSMGSFYVTKGKAYVMKQAGLVFKDDITKMKQAKEACKSYVRAVKKRSDSSNFEVHKISITLLRGGKLIETATINDQADDIMKKIDQVKPGGGTPLLARSLESMSSRIEYLKNVTNEDEKKYIRTKGYYIFNIIITDGMPSDADKSSKIPGALENMSGDNGKVIPIVISPSYDYSWDEKKKQAYVDDAGGLLNKKDKEKAKRHIVNLTKMVKNRMTVDQVEKKLSSFGFNNIQTITDASKVNDGMKKIFSSEVISVIKKIEQFNKKISDKEYVKVDCSMYSG